MSDPRGIRKRPAAPRSRGNSPPSQRMRHSEHNALPDRYAHTTYPRSLPSPPCYRRYSVTSPSDDARWRPAHYPTDERRVDQNRRNSSRDTLHGHERMSGVGSANSGQPGRDQIMSPMSNRSGSSTPVPAAPTVPSMMPIAQRKVAEHSAPMDTLNALRSHKSLRSSNMSQAASSSNTEVTVLKGELRAAGIEAAKLKADLRRVEEDQKQLADLPAQIRALKSLVEQQQTAIKHSTLTDLDRRLSVLENAKSAVATQQFAQLQSDMEATKINFEKLQSLVAQPSKIGSCEEPLQAITENEVKNMIRSALEPETQKMVTFRTQQGNDLRDLSKMVEANRKIYEDVNQRDLPGQLRTLEKDLRRVADNEKKTWDKASTLDEKLETVKRNLEGLERRIYGPNRVDGRANSEVDKSVIQRLGDLEGTLRSLQKEQNHLQENQKGLSELVKKSSPAPGKLTSPSPTLDQSRLEILFEDLNTRLLGLDAAMKEIKIEQVRQTSVTGQVKAFQSDLSKLASKHKNLSTLQESMQKDYDARLEQDKEIEGRHSQLLNDHKTMAEQIKELQTEQVSSTNLQKTNLDDQSQAQMLNKIRHLAHEQMKANGRLTELEAFLRSQTRTEQSNSSHTSGNSLNPSVLDVLEERLQSVERCIDGENGLNTIFKGLEEDVVELQQETHNLKNRVTVLSTSFKEIFAEQFDPFKETVTKQLEMHSNNLSQHSQSLSKLQDQVAKAQHECPAPTFSSSQSLLIRSMIQEAAQATPDLTHLQESVNAEIARWGAAVEDVKRQLATKQGIVTGTQAIDTVKAAVRNLQNQYDNISTDDLHQKMAHWFLQHYPAPAANLLQKFDVIQHDIAHLRGFLDLITRIPNGVQSLSKLAQIGPQITALVHSPSGSKEVEGKLVKTNEPVDELEQSVAEIHAAFEQSLSALRADVKAGFAKESEARTELATKTLNEQQQRVQAKESIKTMIKDQFDDLENGKIKTTFDQIEEIRQTLQAFKVFDSSFDKELIVWLPTIFHHVGQMQKLCEDLNQNLPKGPLALRWSYNWKKEMKIKGPYEYDPEAEEAAGSGQDE